MACKRHALRARQNPVYMAPRRENCAETKGSE